MKIKFLGTAHGVPLKDRFCSSTMLEFENCYYLVDAGAPAVDLILRDGKDINDLRAVFTTHAHLDHTVGLIHLTNLMSWYYKESSADFYLTNDMQKQSYESVISAGDQRDFVYPERLRFHVTDPDSPYEDENIKLDYFINGHMKNSYSILVTDKTTGKKVLFSGDFSGMLVLSDVPKILSEQEIDVFVCEMAHFGVKELEPYLDTCKAKSVCFTHVFPLDKYDGIEALKDKYAFEIHSPSDGDIIEF